MSNFIHNTGYIYPLPQMTDEERFEYLGKVNEEATFDLDADKFMTEQLGDNEYLLWVTSSSYGKEFCEFGSCRPCNQKEIYYHAPKFREILGKIDTKKLKYIDFCYYNSTECTTDYYLSEEQVSETDAIQSVIQHCKTQAPRNCGVMYEPYMSVVKWLQELQGYKDETPITNEFLETNGFKRENIINPYHKGEISIQKMCGGIGNWTWECVYFKGKSWTSDLVDTVFIKTLGELRMFLTLCGLGDFANQLKN